MSADPRITSTRWFRADETRRVIHVLGTDDARFVGGIVRDSLLGRLPDPERDGTFGDVDIATRHEPARTMELAEAAGFKAVPTGIDHGTITIVVEGIPYEVTSLRRDVETDGRRAVVNFTRDWGEDAVRRDFTLNALYADADGVIHDETGQGLDDLDRRIVRFIGDAETRIREDYLRILRYFRFAAMLGADAQWDEDALDTCTGLKDGIDSLSAERLRMEMLKLLSLPTPLQACQRMEETGILDKVIPGAACGLWFGALCSDRAERGEEKPRALSRLFALKGPLGRLDRLRLSKAEQARLDLLDAGAELALHADRHAVLIALYRFGREAARALFQAYAHHPEAQCPDWSQVQEWAKTSPVPVFPLKGQDLLDHGLPPGPDVGQTLSRLEKNWIESGFTLNRQTLLSGL